VKSFLSACVLTLLLLNCSTERTKASAQTKADASQDSLNGAQSIPELATTEAEPLGALDSVSALPLSAEESAALLTREPVLQSGLVAGESAAEIQNERDTVRNPALSDNDLAKEGAPDDESLDDYLMAGGASAASRKNEPPWMNDKVPSATFWGTGSAKQSSEGFSLTMAEARARADIAQQVYQFAQKAGYKQVAQDDVLSMQLENSRVIRQWQAPDGTWWCLVEYSEVEAEKALGKLNLGG
jgi:hypothetical protein